MTTLLFSRTTHKVLSKSSGKSLYSSINFTGSIFNRNQSNNRLLSSTNFNSLIGSFSNPSRHLSTSIATKHSCCGGHCKSTSSKDPNERQTTTIISTTPFQPDNQTDTMSPATVTTPFSLPTHTKTPARHLLSIADLTPKELQWLVDEAARVKAEIKAGTPPSDRPLQGKTVAMMFSKRSTRTRVSTEGAVVYLGGHPMFLGKDDIQLGVSHPPSSLAILLSNRSPLSFSPLNWRFFLSETRWENHREQ